jgi:hypothetical protein
MDYGLAPFVYEGCRGTKPITVPCDDSGLLLAVTGGLWVLAVLAGLLVARRRGRTAPTEA